MKRIFHFKANSLACNNRVASLLLSLFMATPMIAQTLTREAYREKVTAYSQILKQVRQNTVAGEASLSIAKKGFLPRIDFNAEGTINLNQADSWSGDGPGMINVGGNGTTDMSYFPGTYRCYTYSTMVTVGQPLYTGGGLRAQKKMAETDLKINELTEELTLDQIHYQADAIYWNASATLAMMEVMTLYRKIVGEQYEVIEARFNDGAISRTDLLMIQTRSKEAELQFIEARRAYKVAMQNLKILMGVSPDTPDETLDKIDIQTENILPKEFADVLTLRPDFTTTQLRIDKMVLARKATLSQYNPQLSAFVAGGWNTNTPYMSTPMKFNTITGLTLSVPILRWNERGQNKRRQNAYITVSELEKSSKSDAILKEYSNAMTNVSETRNQVNVAGENLEVAQLNLDLNTFSYNEGRSSIVEVLSSQLSWVQAQTNLISAQVSNKMAIAEYRRVISE